MKISMSAFLFLLMASCSSGSGSGPDDEGGGLPDARSSSSGSHPDAGTPEEEEPSGTQPCPAGQFACDEEAATPVCMSEDKFCDGVSDCANGYDESPEECVNPCAPDGGTSTSWPCEDGTCLEESKFCDGTPDCPDGSDEIPAECA